MAGFAVIGAGWWAQGWHIPHLHRNPKSKIIAIVEPNAQPTTSTTLQVELDSTQTLAEKYQAKIYSTYQDLIQDHQILEQISGVIIATSHKFHAEIATAFLQAGKHVLIEKPMAIDLTESRNLTELANSLPQQVCMINHTSNFRQNCQIAQKLVSQPDFGKINHVLCVMYSPLLWFFEDQNNTSWTQPSGSMLANGFGYGQICHLLGWVHYVSGLRSQEVTCHMHFSRKSKADLINAALVKCENNASISISAGCAWPGTGVTQDEMSKHFDIKIFGEHGVLQYFGQDTDPTSGRLDCRYFDQNKAPVIIDNFYFENSRPEGDGPESLQEFIKACNSEDFVNCCDQNVGLRVIETISLMYQSAISQKTERL